MEDEVMKESSKYRQIMKGTTLFGSVQVFQILVSVLRGKIIAFALGSDGMGISNLYVSSLSIFITIASLGCNLSAVRHVSLHKNDENIYSVILIIHRLFIFLSMFGMLLTVLFSFSLSKVTFNSTDHIASFLILSIYVFFSIYNSGNISIMQGLGRNKNIAFVNLGSAIVGFMFSSPLLLLFKMNAIVWVLMIVPVVSSVYSAVLLRRTLNSYAKTKVTFKEFKDLSKVLTSLGIAMVLSQLMGSLATYLINLFISRRGNVSDVGFFQAANSITNQCVGIVLSAMSIDYFPRLSAVSNDTKKMNETVNYQGIITVLLAFPILTVFMGFAPIAIKILLTNEFLVITELIRILALGMLFKVISFSIGYISFSKGDRKTFLMLEGVWCNIQNTVLALIGYDLNGLVGLAYSFVVNYAIYLGIVFAVGYVKYSFTISRDFFLLSLISLFVLTMCFFINMLFKNALLFNFIFAATVCFFSFYELNRKCDLKNAILWRIHKK